MTDGLKEGRIMAIKLTEIDTGALYESLVRAVEVSAREPLYPGDERRIFAEALVAVAAGLQNHANALANAKTLSGASGAFLDALGERTDTERIPAKAAGATFRFTLASPLPSDLTVPAGTSVTTDGELYFEVPEAFTIPAGAEYGDAYCVCTEPGEAGNGYGPGAVGQLATPVAGVHGAANLDETSGGADEEEDDDYRERIRLSPAKYSTAGTEKGYKYWAFSADASIADVVVDVPEACRVDIYVLCSGGTLPSEDVLRAVEESCRASDRRPLTDYVRALPPEAEPYDVVATYYTTGDEEEACVAAIEGPGGALERYANWQSGAIGRAVNPDKLLSMCMEGDGSVGCSRMSITSPAHAKVGKCGVAVLRSVQISHVAED